MAVCACLVYRHKTPGGGGGGSGGRRGVGGAAGRCMEWVATQDIAKMDGIINSPRPEELKYSDITLFGRKYFV